MTDRPPNQHDQDRGHERDRSLRPQIWIGSLADYNAGRLHGDWIDAAVDDDELLQAARGVIASSSEPGAEEWAIFDFEGFGAYRVGEYADLDTVARVARGIQEHGPAFAAWADHTRHEDTDRLDDFEEAFLGDYDTEAAWAEEVIADLAGGIEDGVASWLRPYIRINYEAFARDSSMGGDVEFIQHQGGVWVFDDRV